MRHLLFLGVNLDIAQDSSVEAAVGPGRVGVCCQQKRAVEAHAHAVWRLLLNLEFDLRLTHLSQVPGGRFAAGVVHQMKAGDPQGETLGKDRFVAKERLPFFGGDPEMIVSRTLAAGERARRMGVISLVVLLQDAREDVDD